MTEAEAAEALGNPGDALDEEVQMEEGDVPVTDPMETNEPV